MINMFIKCFLDSLPEQYDFKSFINDKQFQELNILSSSIFSSEKLLLWAVYFKYFLNPWRFSSMFFWGIFLLCWNIAVARAVLEKWVTLSQNMRSVKKQSLDSFRRAVKEQLTESCWRASVNWILLKSNLLNLDEEQFTELVAEQFTESC